MKCPRCQTANVANAAFCDACGARLEAISVIQEGETSAAESRIFVFDTSIATIAPGTVYLLAGKLEQAASMAERAAALAAERRFRGSEARAEMLLGQLAARGESAEFRQADRHLNRCIKIADELGMWHLLAECHGMLARLYRDAR